MMRIGRLRRRVQVQINTPTTNARGQQVPSWSNDRQVWARVLPMSAADTEQDNKLTNKRRYEVTVRGGLGITSANRIVWSGKYFSVNASVDDERSRETVLTCTEVTE